MKKTLKKILALILTLCILSSLLPAVYAEESDSLLSKEELEVLKITNQEREKEGLDPLTSLPELQKATDIRAVELVELFSHTRPDGNTCYTVFKEVTLPGYKTAYGGNAVIPLISGIIKRINRFIEISINS